MFLNCPTCVPWTYWCCLEWGCAELLLWMVSRLLMISNWYACRIYMMPNLDGRCVFLATPSAVFCFSPIFVWALIAEIWPCMLFGRMCNLIYWCFAWSVWNWDLLHLARVRKISIQHSWDCKLSVFEYQLSLFCSICTKKLKDGMFYQESPKPQLASNVIQLKIA